MKNNYYEKVNLSNILNMKLLCTILCLIVFSAVAVSDPITITSATTATTTSEVLVTIKDSPNIAIEQGVKEYVKVLLMEVLSKLSLTTHNFTNITEYNNITNVTDYSTITNINNGIASAVSLIPLFASGAISATTGTVVALKCATETMGISNLLHTTGCFGLIGTTATFGGTFVQIFSSYWSNLDSATVITVAVTVISFALLFAFMKVPVSDVSTAVSNPVTYNSASVGLLTSPMSSNYSTTGLLTNATIGDIASSVTSSPIVSAAVSSPAVEALSLLS